MNKNIYFISDAHLGCKAIKHQRTLERRLVRFLDDIRPSAEAIYLLGDMFDFWFEYDEVVPKGFTRFLGKLSELTDSGIEVHLFAGNHDMWFGHYLQKECGVILHREACTMELHDKVFYLSHGHMEDVTDKGMMARLMFWCFNNRVLRRMSRMIHPHWFVSFGQNWAKHNRLRHEKMGEPQYLGKDKEQLVVFAQEYARTHPAVNYFIFGHRHIELHEKVCDADMYIIGEWFEKFTYAVYNGNEVELRHYIEGEELPVTKLED